MKIIKTRLSFQNQLTLLILIVLGMALIAFTSVLKFKVNQDLSQSLTQKVILDAKLAALKTPQFLQSKNYPQTKAYLKELNLTQSVAVAAISLSNNRLLADYPPQMSQVIFDLNQKNPLTETKQHLILVEPVKQAGKTIGHLFIAHDLKKLKAHEFNYFIITVLIFCLLLILSLLLAYRFKIIMARPLKQMLSNIDFINQTENFNKRLSCHSKNEVSQLSESFNQILDTVQQRENELTAHSQQLQRLVDVRTGQLHKKAHYDSLTNLPNRYLLVDRLHQAISKASRTKSTMALLYLDLDRFKVINDNLGHQNGDLLLKQVAKRLLNVSRESDTVARLGGDEFVFLLENFSCPHDPARTANRIIESFKTPFNLQEHILHISTSIGISLYPENGENFESLLKNADISMYHAKRQGPGNYSFYTEDMNETSLERLNIESNLRTAIEKDEFYLVYQPQLRLKDDQCKNVEALLRWRNDNVGPISPGTFVPIAEETGMVNQIDLWVIKQVCQQINQWNQQGLDDITVAINISAGHLISQTLYNYLKEQIDLNNIKTSQIEIEITEAVFVKHTERTIQSLKAFKALGIRISIDDFGTGYSSLQYIQDFPADTLKLDGMFLNDLKNNPSSQGIVRSTIILAHSIGLELVSECVEDQFQLDFLREHQCDLVQGFLYSKPLLPDKLFQFCKSI